MTTAPQRTLTLLADEIIADLRERYDLVHVAYDDKLTDTQVSALVRGDWTSFWDSTTEWESDIRHTAVAEIIRDEGKDVIDRWSRLDDTDHDPDTWLDNFEHTDQWERVREAIEERDFSRWAQQLADQTPAVLLRIGIDALDEDHAFYRREVAAAEVLARIGFEATEHNLAVVTDQLAECSPEFSILMGYWVVGADVRHLFDLDSDADTTVEITDPHLYLGNPFAGSGWITEKPLTGTVRLRRDQLTTDTDAFGYSLDNVYGGLTPSQYAADLRTVHPEEATA